EEKVFEDSVISIVVPGEAGYLGVLADHAPLVTTIRMGRLEVTDRSGQRTSWKISSGFLEVVNNSATILTEEIEKE
ncbi:MAG TPA: F0F1 ATP synthase subunit epsilon, partial [Nitrospiria bacterium]|nr:F0F1 ATP synthase subunit epsilon [Nitrospiria bacterium]